MPFKSCHLTSIIFYLQNPANTYYTIEAGSKITNVELISVSGAKKAAQIQLSASNLISILHHLAMEFMCSYFQMEKEGYNDLF
jgi:hypothetical protein